MNSLISYQKRGKFQTSLATPEDVKEAYHAVRLHFESKTYSYTKYNGKLKKERFSDKFIYNVIAKGKFKNDFPAFFIPAMFNNPKTKLDYFISEDYHSVWHYWNGYQTSPYYYFKSELNGLKQYLDKRNLRFDDLFFVKPQNIPLIYRLLIINEISPQTLIYLNQVLNFNSTLGNKITEEIFFPKLNFRMEKLLEFVKPQKTEKLKHIMKEVFLT